MKSTGIVRKVDELGRIVLPMELRKMLDLNVKDPVEIFVDDERIILQKYYPACIFCGDADDVVYYNGKRICAKCLNNLKTKYWSSIRLYFWFDSRMTVHITGQSLQYAVAPRYDCVFLSDINKQKDDVAPHSKPGIFLSDKYHGSCRTLFFHFNI